eukprot:SAG11_NODE_14005_length_629_cov_0.784906_1_plen_164_part_10
MHSPAQQQHGAPGAILCDRVFFEQHVCDSDGTQGLADAPQLPGFRRGDESTSQLSSFAAVEDKPSLRERLYWTGLGLGCTYFINDTMFLELPYWVASQPEGLALGSRERMPSETGCLTICVCVVCDASPPCGPHLVIWIAGMALVASVAGIIASAVSLVLRKCA